MEGKRAWQTRADTTHVQAWAQHAKARDTRIQRSLSTLGFVNVNCVAGFLCQCVNTHNKQIKARAGGLLVEHPGCCLVGQTGSRCASALCPSLRHARASPVETWALPFSGLEGLWISVQRHYKRGRHRSVHSSKHSSLNLASVPSHIVKLVIGPLWQSAPVIVSLCGPDKVHISKTKVCRPEQPALWLGLAASPFCFVFLLLCSHTASPPITSATHTNGVQ